MEVPDLRDMVEDEVAHKDFEAHEAQVVDKAIRYIRDSERWIQLLDLVVEETINASLKAELRRSWRQ
ncbi:Uncharacterised protein [Flavonifractor plautii]|nr:Uncharacterised protein [Flavonifractor plautii]